MISSKQARPTSCPGNARNGLEIALEARLPSKKPLVKTRGTSRKLYTTLSIGLAPKQAKKLKGMAQKRSSALSPVLREILASYLKKVERKSLSHEPLKKTSLGSFKVRPYTITKEQDLKLRELSEKTGRSISELVREAVEWFVQ